MTDHQYRPELPRLMIEDAVRGALLEDLGRAGDITTMATIGAQMTATARMTSREDGIVSGIEIARASFALIDPAIAFDAFVRDGDRVSKGDDLAIVTGNARAILTAERTALNYLMHLCGIATLTARYAAEISHTRARVTCTRKTVPGLRAFAKHAVRCGGGSTHRYGLDDAILIKDNHIAVAGGVAAAIRAGKAFAGHLVKVECEVTTLDELREALAERPDVILLDNMEPRILIEAVAINDGLCVLEASGGISLDTIREVAETGVDYISTSKITMAAPTLDIGLDVVVR